MNLVPEFLSWIHRGVLVSNLKSRLALSQPGTSTSLEKEKNQQPDILYQGKTLLPFTGRRKIKDLQREACKQQQSRDKSNLLAVRLGRNCEVGVPGDLNSFQLWARWWYTMGCSKGEMMGFANSSRSFCLDTRYLTFKPNFLRPQFEHRNSCRVLHGHKKNKKKTGPLPTGCVSENHCGIPELTYKSQRVRGCSLTL